MFGLLGSRRAVHTMWTNTLPDLNAVTYCMTEEYRKYSAAHADSPKRTRRPKSMHRLVVSASAPANRATGPPRIKKPKAISPPNLTNE